MTSQILQAFPTKPLRPLVTAQALLFQAGWLSGARTRQMNGRCTRTPSVANTMVLAGERWQWQKRSTTITTVLVKISCGDQEFLHTSVNGAGGRHPAVGARPTLTKRLAKQCVSSHPPARWTSASSSARVTRFAESEGSALCHVQEMALLRWAIAAFPRQPARCQ